LSCDIELLISVKKIFWYVPRTLLSVVVIYEFVKLPLLALIVIGLRDNIIRDDKNDWCTCKVF